MNPKHEAFAREYVVTGNGSEAARRVGYSANKAGQQAAKLLRRADVQEVIARLRTVAMAKITITLERVLEELTLIATAPLGHEHVKPADKRAALADLMRHFGAFNDNVSVTGSVFVLGATPETLTSEQWAAKHAKALHTASVNGNGNGNGHG